MQYRAQPQSMRWKIAFLIIALVGDVSCIRNSDAAHDEQKHISAKLKNFFPSEPAPAPAAPAPEVEPLQSPQLSARVSNGGFRPSQLLEFTPSDVMHGGFKRYPPSYLEPNYKREMPSSLSTIDKQFSFPDEGQREIAQVPTTPVVSYLDPFTQQNYRYTPTSTPPSYSSATYLREQPHGQEDQVYTVQSSLLVGNHSPNSQQTRPGIVEDVYLKRPGYVFDENASSPSYRRPVTTTTTAASPAHKISYDSHDYPPPSYAAQQTSNFVPQPTRATPPPRPPPSIAHRPPYNRQDVNDNRPLAGSSIHEAAYASQPHPSSYASSSSSSPGSSNYANNFGNYLQRPPGYPSSGPTQSYPSQAHYQYEPLGRPPQQQYQQQQRPGHNYYEYQIGEIPPQRQQQQQQQQQFNYRPGTAPSYRPPYQEGAGGGNGGGGGLATLASLFGSTQQYAPQFTNLLLGGAPSSSSPSSSPLGSLLGAFAGAQQQQPHPAQRPPNTQLIRALENIARNDDLQCVPKVLCQMIAGQTLRGQLPSFITSPAITNFLAGFPVASPALIYGRAALLGISGGERSCIQTYEKCPKNEMEIIHYLNNHRGGFFKFFSEPEEGLTQAQQSETGGGSLFSLLSALTGGAGQAQVTRTTPRPVARPTQRPSTDIADGIGSFFTRVLSEYLSGVEFQRRRRRRRSLLPTEIKLNIQTDKERLMAVDFHDEEDDLDTQNGQRQVKFLDDDEEEAAKAHTELIGVLQFPDDEGEGRVLNFKGIQSEEERHDGAVRFPDATPEAKVIYEFNRNAAQRKLRFPKSDSDEQVRQAKNLELAEGWSAVLPNGLTAADYGVDKRRGKRIVFKDTNEHVEQSDEYFQLEQAREEDSSAEVSLREQQVQLTPPNAVYEEAAPPQRGARVIFPDHYERHIRKGKILTRPTYAPSYEYNERPQLKEERFVVSDEHRPIGHYRLEDLDYQTNYLSSMNQGEYVPGNQGEYVPGSTVRFEESQSDRPHYNYPNVNYVSDNRYSSAYQTTSTRRPKHEDDKNIYVTNAQGITEYYVRPDGRKVYLASG